MSAVELKTHVSFEQLLDAVSQLPPDELERFIKRLEALKQGFDQANWSTVLSAEVDLASVQEHYKTPGPWALKYPCGLQLFLEHDGQHLLIKADVHEPEHICQHLSGWALPLEPTQSQSAQPWQLWRQDDNGNEFFMTAFTTNRGAQCVADTFEARGHKQCYWVTHVS